MYYEEKYFDAEQLIAIETFCSESFADRESSEAQPILTMREKQKMVASIMSFLEVKGFLTGRQKGAVLGIIARWAKHPEWDRRGQV
jgi:hypothetical protein